MSQTLTRTIDAAYREKFPASAKLSEKGKKVFPDGVTHDGRFLKPFPVYIEHALGSKKYDADGNVETVFPPTGRTFASTQTHWFHIADGKVIEHWANRDDIGTAKQLRWVPPTPAFLFRMARAKRRAARAARV